MPQVTDEQVEAVRGYVKELRAQVKACQGWPDARTAAAMGREAAAVYVLRLLGLKENDDG